MDDGLRIMAELAAVVQEGLFRDLGDVGAEERDWRPVPDSNTINLIVRHLRIEADWHLDSLESGKPMPTVAVPASQAEIDAVSVEFDSNVAALSVSLTRFCELLQDATPGFLQARTSEAYGGSARPVPQHFLAYHQIVHLAMHWGQIRTLHNLYRKARGQSPTFPDNPTYPRTA